VAQFSTQQYIEIAGIKDGIVILKNGGYRLIISVSTTNFALKSEQEQNSIIFQYQSFLNSLHFPIEIVMRSKRLDLSPYLNKISKLMAEQQNELLQIQTADYVDFVTKLIEIANIMKKSFYVVIPYQPINLESANFLTKLFRKKTTVVSELRISEEEFRKNADKLREYGQIVADGLGKIGLHCFQLTTKEIIELFYQIYNPEIASKERITDPSNLTSEVVMSTTEKRSTEENQDHQVETEQSRIDNSSEVAELTKQQAALKRQEMLKEGERQIGMTKPAQGTKREEKSPANTTPVAANPAPPTNNQQPPAQTQGTNIPNAQTPAPQPQPNLAYHLQNPTGKKE
jgi:hypothetical protein